MDPEAIAALLAKVAAAGGRIRWRDGGLTLVPGNAADNKVIAALLPDLRTAKADLIRHFQSQAEEHPGSKCDVCGALVYTTSPEVFRLCRMVLCPAWRPGCGVGPEWLATERNMLAYKARQGQDKAA